MTPSDLTCLQVNILGHHDDQREFTGKYTLLALLKKAFLISAGLFKLKTVLLLLSTSHLSGQVSTDIKQSKKKQTNFSTQ